MKKLFAVLLLFVSTYAYSQTPYSGVSDGLWVRKKLGIPNCTVAQPPTRHPNYGLESDLVCLDTSVSPPVFKCWYNFGYNACGGAGSGIIVDDSYIGTCGGFDPTQQTLGQQCWDANDGRMYCNLGSSWGDCAPGATPAGSSTEFQYRNGTSLGAADVTFTPATSTNPSITSFGGDTLTNAGYNLSGDSQGVQFYPGKRRAAAMAIAAKKRGDTKFVAPTTNPVVIIGDSIMATASQAAWRIWDERFKAYGLGFDPLVDCDIYHGNFTWKTETWNGTWDFRHVGSLGCLTATAPNSAVNWGLAGQSATADAGTDTLTYIWAHPVRANRARIWYAKHSGGGHFEYRANGGTWTDVNTFNATLDAGYVSITLSASILLEGTLEVRWASGGPITLYGIETYAADTQGDRIEFNNTLPYFLTAGGQALTGVATSFDNYGVANTPIQTFIRTVKPSQVILTLGANDACYGGLAGGCSTFTSAADYEAALQRVITALNGYFDSANVGDIVLTTALPRGTHGSGTENATVGSRLDSYRTIMFKLAKANGLSVWDLRKFWPSFAEADSAALNLYDDGTHPSPTGKALLMRAMSAWLDPDPWKGDRTNGIYCGTYGLSSGTVIWPECTFGSISGAGTFHTISACDYRFNFGRTIDVSCFSGATWEIDADSTTGNVRAGSDFVCRNNAAIRFVCDGVNWRETGRSAPAPTTAQRQAEMYAHATLYGDSDYYTRPAYFDTAGPIFRNSALVSTYDWDGTTNPGSYGSSTETMANVQQLYGGTCSGNAAYVCITARDTNADSTVDMIDPDADGTAEFKVQDVFVIGSTSDLTTATAVTRTHLITALTTDSANCGTSALRATVNPQVACTAEGLAANSKLFQAWRQSSHAGFTTWYLTGYRLGYGSRLLWGAQGPDLLQNGEMEWNTVTENWSTTGTGAGTTARAWQSNLITAGINVLDCVQGTGSNDCFYMTDGDGTFNNTLTSSSWIPVRPGERYVLSGTYAESGAGNTLGLVGDTNNDGTLAYPTGLSWSPTASDVQLLMFGLSDYFWKTFTVPSGVNQVKVQVDKTAATANRPGLDDFSLRRVTTYGDDSYDSTAQIGWATSEFLINDPGTRNIVITGDSWTTYGEGASGNVYNLGYHFKRGLAAALQARFGRDISSQIIVTGMSGQTADGLLNGNTCDTDNDDDGTLGDWNYGTGALNCWNTQIVPYEPLYVIVNLGTNDALTSVATTTFVSRMRQIAAKLRGIGAIPIFLGVPPTVKDENADHAITSSDFGTSTAYERAHLLRDALKSAIFNWVP